MEVSVHVPLAPCSGDLSRPSLWFNNLRHFLRSGPVALRMVTPISVTLNFPHSPACAPTRALGVPLLRHLPLCCRCFCTKHSPGIRGGNQGFGAEVDRGLDGQLRPPCQD